MTGNGRMSAALSRIPASAEAGNLDWPIGAVGPLFRRWG